MNPVAVAARGKGARRAARRARHIGSRYGLRPHRMDRRVGEIHDIVARFGTRPTLPITAAVVERHPHVFTRYARLGVEFAVHGLHHVDHVGRRYEDQLAHFTHARRVMQDRGVEAAGFRAPYLRVDDTTIRAVRDSGFLYDASQAVHWPVAPHLDDEGYRRGLEFYGALDALEHPAVPWIEDGLVRIPYTLPDDEAVADRLALASHELADLWLGVLAETHRRGELFTLAVHPERIDGCGPAIAETLEAARSLEPEVWVAPHDEIARWWRDRAATTVTVHARADGSARIEVAGPEGLTLLARGGAAPVTAPWSGGYGLVAGAAVDLAPGPRPFLGVHPATPAAIPRFLREQGYLVEVSEAAGDCTYHVARDRFGPTDRRALLDEIEDGDFPLLRCGRWPGGARSALSVTGDIDALTIRDYALRFVGR